MTDDKDKIKEITNLNIGKIVNDDVEHTYKGNICNIDKQGCIYDERSYNFHLLPEDISQFECYSKLIKNKREKLVDLLSELGWKIEKDGSRGNIQGLISKTGKNYKSEGHLFSFIRIRYNGVFYDINFNRFYIDKATVYCKLYEPQFSCRKCNPGYPQSGKGGEYSFGTMYYNSNHNFDDNSNLIEEFIKFVCEGSKKLIR